MTTRIEFEPSRINKVAEASAALTLPAPVPLGISGDSSLSSARATPLAKISSAVMRPFLPLPDYDNYIPQLLKVEQEMTRILEKEGDQLDAEISLDIKRLEKFNREKIELLQNHAHELKAQSQWGAWAAVTEYVAYSSSIALGLGCLTSGVGTAPALFLIASGVIGLVNRMGADSGAWHWTASCIEANQQKQLHLAQTIENALTATAIALSIVGACGAYHVGLYEKLALASRESAMSAALQAIAIAGNALQLVQKAGEGYHNHAKLQIQADMKSLTANCNALKARMSMEPVELQKMFKLTEEIDAVIKAAIASSTV